MDKQAAIKLITQTFDAPFDEQRFANFARNLFNQIDESKAFSQQGVYIWDAFKDHVRQYKRLGTYTDPEGTKIDILIVRLKKGTALSRARTMQRNFVARHLRERDEKDAAIVAYYTDGQPDWRFSLVKMEYQIHYSQETDRLKVKESLTPARRYSFLVGQNEPNHTAQQQLVPILQETRHNPTLAQLEAAFNIESVTKDFFQKYKALFLDLKDELDRLTHKQKAVKAEFDRAGIETANFAKKLLGQIVFLYFLQKKGWLGVAQGQTWGSGPKDFLRRLFEKKGVAYASFFNDVLDPLFYEALAIERPGNFYPRLNCRIPFLNGGLFEPVGDYNWQSVDILLNNARFRDIFDTFDLFNFTVREDEPLEKEVAVDPEMLGKVFENLLEVTDRKSKGAFYTPREIVHYMCQESLINYLDTSLNPHPGPPPFAGEGEISPPVHGGIKGGQVSSPRTRGKLEGGIPRADIDALIRQGEFGLEHGAAKASGTKSYQYQLPQSIRSNAAAIDDALANIKICDPAIGSGAFPVGLMQEIVKARTVLTMYLTPPPNLLPDIGEGEQSPPVHGGIKGRQQSSPLVRGELEGGKRWQTSPELWAKLKPLARQMRREPTPAENKLWQRLRNKQILDYKFRRQHAIGRFIVDFYCRQARLVIEVDGPTHDYTIKEDAIRQEFLESQNLRVIRFSNADVLQNIDGVLQKIVEVVSTPPPNPLPDIGEGEQSPPVYGGIKGGQQSSPLQRGELEGGRTPYHFKRHAIQESIYGVDIDPGAVDIAKLRLWLSLVVDEDSYENIQPLPNLDYKIVRGNALLGVEKDLFNRHLFEEIENLKPVYFAATGPAEKRALKSQIDSLIAQLTHGNTQFDFEIYFSEVFHHNGGFDVVIGNPPYVRHERIKAQKPALKKAHPNVYQGTADLYVYFYSQGIKILRRKGFLAFITGNKFMRAGYGKKLRQFLAKETAPQTLIDFGDLPVFDATAYPCIVITQKTPAPAGNIVTALTVETVPQIEQITGVMAQHAWPMPQQKALTPDGWRLEPPQVLNLLDKLRKAGTPLGEYVKGRFYYGIKTGYNEAFVIDRATRDRLIAEHPSSAEIIKPFLRGRDVKRWAVTSPDLWLIFTRRGINIDEYPAVKRYLLPFKERLTPKPKNWKGKWSGRKAGSYQWYEIQDNIAYWQEFEEPKIAYPNICKRNEFAWDEERFYTNQKAFIIPNASKYLLGVLNSSVVMWLFDKMLAKLQNGFYEPSAIFMEKFPIP